VQVEFTAPPAAEIAALTAASTALTRKEESP